jgi:cobalt-precorrin-5B (C1)-methyltransferase
MDRIERTEFDLNVRAPNGLRRGRTTGSCATAAVKAALTLMLYGEKRDAVSVTLPTGSHYLNPTWTGAQYLTVPIQQVAWLDAAGVRAEVFKEGGDDPDSTHGATIFAEVRPNAIGEIRFYAGAGVGTVTQPGIRVAVGEPAINPVPRQMMRLAVTEVLAEHNMPDECAGFDLTIGCVNGEAIARKTFNPRLGIVGGISILGTSGVVEPMSMASWIASIDVYVRVALGGGAESVAYLPGKIGREFARDQLQLAPKCVVEIANFLGDALDFTQAALQEEQRHLEVLWLAGHPGKLAKVLDGVWDTHSSKSAMAMSAVARVARERGFKDALVQQIEQANTVEAAMEIIRNEPDAQALWRDIEQRISALVQPRVPLVAKVEVRLFNLNGHALGQAA